MSAVLHDALREQGLVPDGENLHFTACSTWYRHRLSAVSDDMIDPDDYRALERRVERAEGDSEELEDEIRTLKREAKTLRDDLVSAAAKEESLAVKITQLESKIAELEWETL